MIASIGYLTVLCRVSIGIVAIILSHFSRKGQQDLSTIIVTVDRTKEN